MSKIRLSENFIKNTVKLALNEDLYPHGDITSNLLKNDKDILVKFPKNLRAINSLKMFEANYIYSKDPLLDSFYSRG